MAPQVVRQDAQMQTQHRPRRVHVGTESRPIGKLWATSHQACDKLHYYGKHRLRSLYRFLKAKNVRTGRRGKRTLLIDVLDLDRAVMDRSR
jgi:hypothetical protein